MFILLVPTLALLIVMVSRRPSLGLGYIYICPAYVSLLMLRGAPSGFRDVLFLVVVVWGTDIGAYLIGRLVGGPTHGAEDFAGQNLVGGFWRTSCGGTCWSGGGL